MSLYSQSASLYENGVSMKYFIQGTSVTPSCHRFFSIGPSWQELNDPGWATTNPHSFRTGSHCPKSLIQSDAAQGKHVVIQTFIVWSRWKTVAKMCLRLRKINVLCRDTESLLFNPDFQYKPATTAHHIRWSDAVNSQPANWPNWL